MACAVEVLHNPLVNLARLLVLVRLICNDSQGAGRLHLGGSTHVEPYSRHPRK